LWQELVAFVKAGIGNVETQHRNLMHRIMLEILTESWLLRNGVRAAKLGKG
jgi:hypothetical protein